MSQAPASTDELLSQLASSEIDRLLAEAESGPAAKQPPPQTERPKAAEMPKGPEAAAEQPVAEQPAQGAAPEGSERSALLEAAGFESKTAEPAAPPPTEQNERSAILEAAGFESAEAQSASPESELAPADAGSSDFVPIYLKPLVWINSPLDQYPSVLKRMLGGAGIVTLINALAVLTYVLFFRKH